MLFRDVGFFCILLQTSCIKLHLVVQILILFSRSLFVPQDTYIGKIWNSFSIQYENWFLTDTIPDFLWSTNSSSTICSRKDFAQMVTSLWIQTYSWSIFSHFFKSTHLNFTRNIPSWSLFYKITNSTCFKAPKLLNLLKNYFDIKF